MSEVVGVADGIPDELVERVAAQLRDGGLVVLPTDTVYGVAADAFSLDGTAALFRARGQDRSKPLTVLLRSPKQLVGFTPEVPEVVDRLVAAFWPGPLTMILPSAAGMRWDVGRSAGTVAVRMPLDEVALAVVRAVGPLAVSSASVVGGPAPTSVAVAREQLGEAVTCYLDAGPRDALPPSTTVDLTGDEPAVVRPGALPTTLVLAVARGELDPLDAAIEAARTGAAEADGPDASGAER